MCSLKRKTVKREEPRQEPSPGGWGGFLLSLGLARVERSLDAG